MKTWPNKRVETNRRHAYPFSPGRELDPASCARRLRSAAVAHPRRRRLGYMKSVATFIAVAAATVLTGCGAGDSGAVQGFHPKVKVGMLLTDAITEGEKAQHYDIRYRVFGRGSAAGDIEVGRYWQEPYIRITQPPPDPKHPTSQPYRELGYASREDFARAVAETLPLFYDCKRFHFVFHRYQGGSRSDSFDVEVDSAGRITSVTQLSEDRYD